jgi:hypothetical protein
MLRPEGRPRISLPLKPRYARLMYENDPLSGFSPATISQDRSLLRQQLRELLGTRAKPLVGLYDAAIQLLENERHSARRCLVSHCVREIANSLPQYIAGAVITPRVDYALAIARIVPKWREAGLPIGRQVPPASIMDSAGSVFAGQSALVPSEVLVEFGELLDLHERGGVTQRKRAEALFQALNEGREQNSAQLALAVSTWRETTDWFVGSAHHKRNPEEPDSDNLIDEEFVSEFQKFEQQLYVLIQPFLDIARELDNDLEEANS